MPSLEDIAAQRGLRAEGAAFKEGIDRKAIAQQASQLALNGNVNGAIALLGQHDPAILEKYFSPKNQVVQDDQGAYAVTITPGQPSNVEKLTGISGKAQSPYQESVFQVIDPITKEVQLRSRQGGKLIDTIGGPQALPQDQQPDFDPKLSYQSLNPKERTNYDKTFTDFQKDSKDDRAAFVAAAKIKQMLGAGKELNYDILRAFQNQFARASGEKGVMTENDVKPFGGRNDVLSRLERYFTYNSVGQIPEEDRQFLSSLSDAMQEANKTAVIHRADPYAKQVATNTKLNETQARNLLLQGVVDPAPLSGKPETKVVAGKTYMKVPGGWQEQ
jgi:hypothetical protein